MTLHPVLTCAQCAAVIEGDPIALGQQVFCCLGCVGGGPCICDRQAYEALILRVGPFATQAALLAFATRLEHSPGMIHVEMTHASLSEARFSVVAPSTEVVALAVEADQELTIHVETSGSTVVGRVAPPTAPPAQPTRLLPTGDALLPVRTRFRVFRLPTETQTLDEAPVRTDYLAPRPGGEHFPDLPPERAAEPAPASEALVAELLSNARDAAAAVRMRAPEPQPIRRPAAPEPAPAATPTAEAPANGLPATGEIMVVAAPFHSFLALNEFQGVVRALPGVRDTRVRRFYGGTLNLSVDYDDAVPFEDRLRAASGGAWQVRSTAPGRLDVALSEAGSLAGARQS